jgi:hypothetical protein
MQQAIIEIHYYKNAAALSVDHELVLYSSSVKLVEHYARLAEQHYAHSSLPYRIQPQPSRASTSSKRSI